MIFRTCTMKGALVHFNGFAGTDIEPRKAKTPSTTSFFWFVRPLLASALGAAPRLGECGELRTSL
jgi:hypothetical protein